MADAPGAQHLQGHLLPRQRGQRTHLCTACDFPIAVYGRCAPCLHVYCLACAADMAQCRTCGAYITKLERIPAAAGPLYISPITLQGFRSEADLARHVQGLGPALQQWAASGGAIQPAGPLQQQQQQRQQQPPQQPPPPPYGGGMGAGKPITAQALAQQQQMRMFQQQMLMRQQEQALLLQQHSQRQQQSQARQ